MTIIVKVILIITIIMIIINVYYNDIINNGTLKTNTLSFYKQPI